MPAYQHMYTCMHARLVAVLKCYEHSTAQHSSARRSKVSTNSVYEHNMRMRNNASTAQCCRQGPLLMIQLRNAVIEVLFGYHPQLQQVQR